MPAKTIQIKSIEDGLKDFAKTYNAILKDRPVKKQVGTYFASIRAACNGLTENRIQLLKTIKQHNPGSIHELAKLTHRDFKNISDDVAFLHELGLVRLGKPHGPRSKRKPMLLCDNVYLKIAI